MVVRRSSPVSAAAATGTSANGYVVAKSARRSRPTRPAASSR